MPSTVRFLPATTARAWLNDTDEVALLDVREAGQFGEGHPFFAVPAPYSRLELDVPRLVPRRTTRTVLIDDGDGVAERAARRLGDLGYTAVHVLEGGAAGWQAAGYTLFQGVNLPSKTFGELVEHACETPHLTAAALADRLERQAPLVLLDGRTFTEHRKMAIPGAVSVPNGELPRHWRQLAPDATTPIIIHCAGRTRSIIGAQILRSLGIPNPVLALENGTQGWALAGLALEHGSTRRPPAPPAATDDDRAAAARFAREADVRHLDVGQAQAWIDEPDRTTYVLDVRSADEFRAASLAGAVHAPGGQLLQATDQTIGVRKARVILVDDDAVRAPVIAAWLSRLGWQTATVEDGIHADLRLRTDGATTPSAPTDPIPSAALPAFVTSQSPRLLDLQPSMQFRQRHAEGAQWTLRPRLAELDIVPGTPLLLIGAEPALVALAMADLVDAGHGPIAWTGIDDWVQAGLPTAASPRQPDDAEAIDYLFFVHDRHDGNLDAARRYLAWETGLIAQCAPDELAGFRLPQAGADDGAPRA